MLQLHDPVQVSVCVPQEPHAEIWEEPAAQVPPPTQESYKLQEPHLQESVSQLRDRLWLP